MLPSNSITSYIYILYIIYYILYIIYIYIILYYIIYIFVANLAELHHLVPNTLFQISIPSDQNHWAVIIGKSQHFQTLHGALLAPRVRLASLHHDRALTRLDLLRRLTRPTQWPIWQPGPIKSLNMGETEGSSLLGNPHEFT